ncbi:MAG: hypothetical protein IJF40_04690 [Clostridia bacterium]|nr:hypothetical protein [Clostridia bacterium]
MNARICETKQKYVPFALGGREYPLSLALNCIEAFQERYGEVDKVLEKSAQIKELKWIIATLVNEAVEVHNEETEDKWERVTESYVGRHISADDISECMSALMRVFGVSLPVKEIDPAAEAELAEAVGDVPELPNPNAE